jgi:glyoxylase-like metal-dependent hydrolase (beta-lactamase superfamily II)
VSNGEEAHEVFAIKYATRTGPKSREFACFHLYEEPDGPFHINYFFWLVRGPGGTVLVDCGFHHERGFGRGRYQGIDPLEALARMGVRAADVDHVVLSHMHFDHIGNLTRFPNATFSMARAELDFWTGPYASRRVFACAVEAQEIQDVVKLRRDERLRLVDKHEELFPGIRVTPIGGHTPGQMITEVDSASGKVVIASDAIHFYEEMELDRPYILFSDLAGQYAGYETLRELSARPGTAVVAGHDPAVMDRFTALDGDRAGLAVQIG